MRTKLPFHDLRARQGTVLQRLIKRAIVVPIECWEWIGFKNEKGYAVFGRHGGAYRLAYKLLVGPIPKGLTIDHMCGNRACINPSHLRPLTQKDNTLASPNTQPRLWMSRKGCHVCGGPLTSTAYRRNFCAPCRNEKQRLSQARRRETDPTWRARQQGYQRRYKQRKRERNKS